MKKDLDLENRISINNYAVIYYADVIPLSGGSKCPLEVAILVKDDDLSEYVNI